MSVDLSDVMRSQGDASDNEDGRVFGENSDSHFAASPSKFFGLFVSWPAGVLLMQRTD